MKATQVYYDTMASPIGPIMLIADADGLREVRFEIEYRPQVPEDGWLHGPEQLAPVRRQLQEYFAGERQCFEVKLNMRGTAFQQQVWQALTTIPYGVTTSYGQLSAQINRPTASRAVGAANGRNPVPVIVPCHRVIGSNGTLTGFAGGLAAKQWLLAHENRAFQLL